MPNFKSILPFWRRPAPADEASPAPLAGTPDTFGKASGFELLFDRLMDDPEAPRDTLFPTGSCR